MPCLIHFLDLALLQRNSNHFGQTGDEPTNRRVSICSIRALCLDSPHNIYLCGCCGFGFLCFFFFLKLSYEVQIYDGFLGRGNERIEERGEDRKEGGVLERGKGGTAVGGTVAKIKSQETSFDICPFCSGIARPDQLHCARGASGTPGGG